jgi:hypothetical protein
LREIYTKAGTIEMAEETVNNLLDTSNDRLQKLSVSDESYKKYIEFIIDYLRV